MEDILNQAFSTGDIKIVIAALAVYLIVYFQRKDTKSKRDDVADSFDKRLTLLESKADKIDELDLTTKLAQIQTDLNWIKEKLK
jgi:hypothetical protein